MSRTKLLSHYRVLDLGNEAGSFCGALMASLGADVIKIEKPGGDPTRSVGPFYHDLPGPEKSLFWCSFNHNKRSVTLNLESKEGQGIFKRLAGTAHFVIETFPPGHLERLGLGYPALESVVPSIIVVSITPFGQTGPYANFKSCDLIQMAKGGLMYAIGDPDRPPVRISLPQSHFHAGLHAAAAALIAHEYRQKTGKGQHLDVSIQASVARVQSTAPLYWAAKGIIEERAGNFTWRERLKLKTLWPCKEGYVLLRLQGGSYSRRFRPLVEWMDSEGMAGKLKEIEWGNLDLETLSDEQLKEMEDAFGKFFLTHTSKELYEQAVKRNFLLTQVSTLDDIINDDQLAARDFWQIVEYPELGTTMTYPGMPFKFSDAATGIEKRAPLIGEHNAEVFGELGICGRELALLKQDGHI